MSETTQRIKQHSSCRVFQQRPVEQALLDEIFEAARMSSSSCFLQVTSIIRVTDPEKKRIIAQGCKQQFIAQAPELWVFCGDFHRDGCLCEKPSLGWTDHFLVACVDTGIMVQTAMIALESLGLGGVFLGGIRDCVETVHGLLKLPANTVPLLGLAFGYPAEKHEVKPRLPKSVVFMENSYKEPDMETVRQYDETMRNYYAQRTGTKRSGCWSERLEEIINREKRANLLTYLRQNGWLEK